MLIYISKNILHFLEKVEYTHYLFINKRNIFKAFYYYYLKKYKTHHSQLHKTDLNILY